MMRFDHALIHAVLGPTNTGKTHYALERMAGFKSGMIGFPLRLLARENYDRLVKVKGRHNVALITGEEKIIPPRPTHFVCTVEAMPVSVPVDFMCIDEIQLCADPERGHIFTDRLLHARGDEETLFLGAATIKPLLHQILPQCRIATRDRLSPLLYSGFKKLTRLPPRSAIVAFNINDVYRLAEFIRTHRGGTAIVLGALSPRTRNAQVQMYQSGEVDYIVATDAIGMGLNMDIDHVALAATRKFDGQRARDLRPDELAQIAGRAGRYQRPGTFGMTADMPNLDEDIVRAIEEHDFDALTALRWRNPRLDFTSTEHLLHSLDDKPTGDLFTPARQADDHKALLALTRLPQIRRLAQTRDMVRLLWDVCAIPDFRKTLADEHHRLLADVFLYLAQDPHTLPEDWCANGIARLDRLDGDLDTLLNRIAFIRTWTYITHVKSWVRDADHWQGVTRQIEDRLSDALHEKLTLRFVDKRTSHLLRGLANRDKLLAGVRSDGTVVVEGHTIGTLQGWRFMPETTLNDTDHDAVMKAARAALKEPLANAIDVFTQQVSAAFALNDSLQITWRHAEAVFPIAQLTKGTHFYWPKITLLHTELLDEKQNALVLQRLELWLRETIDKALGTVLALENADLPGTAKGVAFQLYEQGGILERQTIKDLLTTVDKEQRQALGKLGVRINAFSVYHRDALKPLAMKIKGALWRLAHDARDLVLPLPQDGNVSMAAPANANPDFYRALGLPIFANVCVRIDMVDRLNSAVFDGAKEGKYAFDPALASTVGVSVETVQAILQALGFPFEDVTVGEGEEAKVTRFYSLKKLKAKALGDKTLKPRSDKKPFEKKSFDKKPFEKTVEKRRRAHAPPDRQNASASTAPKGTTGYNPFASLAALKDKK